MKQINGIVNLHDITDLEKYIKKYEDRIMDANKFPRNCFFIGVKKDAEKKLKILYKLKNGQSKNFKCP